MNHLPALVAIVAVALLAAPRARSATPPDEVTSERRVCLLVFARGLEDVAEEWTAYRRASGWEVEPMAAVDAAGLLPPHWNEPGMMRIGLQQYFRDRYRVLRREGVKGGRIAVLLLGDVSMPDGSLGIPAWYHPKTDAALKTAGEPDDIATDHDYQLMDEADDLPDILLGRIPARTQTEARALLTKVRRYETETPTGAWKSQITYLAGEGHFGTIDRVLESLFVSLVEEVVPYEYDISMTYANPASPYCAPPSGYDNTVLERLGEGAILVNYLGHGMATRLDTLHWNGERIPVCDVGRLERLPDPAGRFPIMLIIACSTGRFDLPEGERSLSEALLFHPNGPIGIMSGSRVTHPYANAVFQKDVTEQICIRRRETLGAVDLAATRALMRPDEQDLLIEAMAGPFANQMDWDSTPAQLRRVHMSLYNLLGDPCLRIAHPEASLIGLEYGDGHISGQTRPSVGSDVTVTIETARSRIPRRREMHPVAGRDDPDLEAKAGHNYRIANDKVLHRANGRTDQIDGSFSILIDPEIVNEMLERFDVLWIKVRVSGAGGDATGAIRLDRTGFPRPEEPIPHG